jgi:hypothetical protein
MTLSTLQGDLLDHDSRNWLHKPGFETDKHNFLHVAKTAGKIATHLEAIDDQKEDPATELDGMVIADLAIEAMRFANNTGQSLEELMKVRMQQIRERAEQPQ